MSGTGSTSSDQLIAAVQHRRTYYGIKNESTISDDKIESIVHESVKHVPMAFNIQTSRAIFFKHDASVKVWDTIWGEFSKNYANDKQQYEANEAKINGYKAGYGSIAIFEDQATLQASIDKMPMFEQAFRTWSDNATGMLQYVIWTALDAEGLGASLQHHFSYSPAIPTAVQKAFDIPESWKCTAILPFGVATGSPGNAAHPKTFEKLDERVRVIS